MKKCLFVITLFLCGVITLFSNEFFEQFDLRRLTANFYGLCFNRSTLLVYGDGGIILRSTDWENWQQISLNDSLCIIDMIYFNNKFYGISRFNYLLFSTDDGVSWELKDFGRSTRFYKLFSVQDSVIAVTRGKILLLGKDLKVIKEIEIPRKESFYRDEYLAVTTLVNDYLLFQYSSNEMCLLSWKEGTYQIFKVDTPQNTNIKEIIPQSDRIFLFFDNESFYELNLGTKSLMYRGTLNPAFSRVFSTFGNDIYMMCNYYINRFNIDSLSFGKFRSDLTFEDIGPSVDRYISQLNFTDMRFKSKDTIIAVGLYKLIMISFDGGRNWLLRSLFNFKRKFYPTLPTIFLFKGKYFRTLGNYLTLFSSNDTGITWLPPKPMKIDHSENIDFLSVSRRMGTYITEEKGFYFADVLYIKEPNFIFTADGGNSFSFDANLSIGNSNQAVPPQLVKYKNDYLFITSGKLQIKGEWTIKNFFRKMDITPEGLQFETVSVDSSMQFLFIHNINDTLYAIAHKELKYGTIDTLPVWASYDGGKNWDSLYSISAKRRTTNTPSLGRISFISIDTLLVDIIHRRDEYNPTINTLQNLYYLNFRDRIFKKLIEFDSSTVSIQILPRMGKYYLLKGHFYRNQMLFSKILFSKNFDLPINKWNELSLNPRYTSFYEFTNKFYGSTGSLPIVEMEKNTLLIQTIDNYHKVPVIFLAKLKPNSILWADTINVDSIDVSSFDLFVTQPYPMPVTNNENLRFRVYFDPSYDYESINFYVSDVMGRTVAENSSFEKVPLTNHSLEVIWNVRNLSQGVYFVIVRLQNIIKEVPIVIIK